MANRSGTRNQLEQADTTLANEQADTTLANEQADTTLANEQPQTQALALPFDPSDLDVIELDQADVVDRALTMDETAGKRVWVTGYETKQGENGAWQMWTGYVEGYEGPQQVMGSGTQVMKAVERFFAKYPGKTLAIAYHKIPIKNNRSFWEPISHGEIAMLERHVPTVTPVAATDDIPF